MITPKVRQFAIKLLYLARMVIVITVYMMAVSAAYDMWKDDYMFVTLLTVVLAAIAVHRTRILFDKLYGEEND